MKARQFTRGPLSVTCGGAYVRVATRKQDAFHKSYAFNIVVGGFSASFTVGKEMEGGVLGVLSGEC